MKKLLAVLLAVTIVLGCVPAFASIGPAIERAEIMSAGEEIDETVWDTVVSGYADIVVTKNSNISVFIASYDRLGRLLDIKSQTTYVNNLEATVYSPELLLDDDSAKVKLFVLDGLMPLGEAKEIPVINSRNKLTVNSDDVFSATVENDYIEFSYFESEEARRATPVTVSSNAKLYINGYEVYAGSAAEIASYIHDGRYPYFYGNITLLNVNNRAEDYDTIVIEDYSTIVVDENNTDTYRITAKNPEGTLSYDPEDTYLYAYLFDTNGNKLNFEDVKENDVISYKEYQSGLNEVIVATLLDNDTVTGIVSSVDAYALEYIINGVCYKGNPLYISPSDIVLGDEVTLYFDNFGKIVYTEIILPPVNYAYVVDIDTVGTLDPRTTLKLYTSDGEYDSFTTSSKVKVDGVSNIDSTDVYDADNDDVQDEYIPVTSYSSVTRSLIAKQGYDWFIVENQFSSDEIITGVKAIEPGQVIVYEVNEQGYITSIDRPTAVTSFAIDNLNTIFDEYTPAKGTFEYSEAGMSFSTDRSRLYTTEDTKIIVAPTKDNGGTVVTQAQDLVKEDFVLTKPSQLTNGQVFYNARAFDVDMDRNVNFILVETEADGLESIQPDQPQQPDQPENQTGAGYGYVLMVGTTGIDSAEPRTAFKLYTSKDEYGVLNTAHKVKVNGQSLFSEDVYGVILSGQVIMYETNDAGEIVSIDTPTAITSTNNAGDGFNEFTTVAGAFGYNEAQKGFETFDGWVYITDETVIMVAPTLYESGYPRCEPRDLREDDVAILEHGLLADEQMLINARAFNVDADRKVKFILVETEVVITNVKPAVLTGVSEITKSNGNSAFSLAVVQDGVYKNSDENPPLVTKYDNVDLSKYSTFAPIYNAKGEVIYTDVFAELDGNDVLYNYGAINYYNDDPYSNVKLYYGEVTDRIRNEFSIGGKAVSINSNTDVYVYYSGSRASNKVTIEDYSAVSFEDGSIYFDTDEVSKVYALAYEKDGDVTDLVLYVFK